MKAMVAVEVVITMLMLIVVMIDPPLAAVATMVVEEAEDIPADLLGEEDVENIRIGNNSGRKEEGKIGKERKKSQWVDN